MLKNKLWIVALFAALTMAFVGCTNMGIFEEEGGEEGGAVAWVTVFDFQDSANGKVTHAIQSLPVGALSFPSADVNPIAPLVRAAEDQHASYEIITVGGKNALKYVTHATWGPGFDLRNSTFGFKAGDKITLKGSATGAPINLAWNKTQGGAQTIVGDRIETEGDFEIVVTLTAADVTSILGNEQKVLRFEDRAGETTVIITQVTIEGNRPTTVVDLEPPVPSVSGNTLSWADVEFAGGYEVYVVANNTQAEADAELLSTVLSGSSLNLDTALAGKGKDTGIFNLKVKALGSTGSSNASGLSAMVSYVYYFYKVTTSGIGTDQTVTLENPRFASTVTPAPGWGVGGYTFVTAERFKVKLNANAQGHFAYEFPSGIEGFDVEDYDFAEITLTTTGTPSAIGYKAYTSAGAGGDAPGLSGSLAAGPIKFEIRKSPRGLVFQKYTANADTPEIEINSVTFSKVIRHNVTFDVNGGAIPSFSETYVADGTAIGDFMPAVSKTGEVFLGWFVQPGDTVLVGASSIISVDTDLKAHWKVVPARTPQRVVLTSADVTGFEADSTRTATVTIIPGTTTGSVTTGNGYKIKVESNGYGNAYAYFTYTFTGGAELSDFNKVTFKYTAIGGDVGSKSLAMVVNDPSAFGYISFDNAPTPFSKAGVTTGDADKEITLTLTQGLAAPYDTLSKTTGIGFAIAFHGGDYEIQITDIVFSQN